MRKRNKAAKNKISLMQRMLVALDIPPDVESGIFIEIRGKSNVCIHGCREILLYTTEKVLIKVSSEIVCVCGSELYCNAYHSHYAEIYGIIKAVGFEED